MAKRCLFVVMAVTVGLGMSACSGSGSGWKSVSSAPTGSVQLPPGPLGHQISYAIALADGQEGPSSYPAHFSGSFLSQVSASTMASVVSQTRPGGPWQLERFLVGPTAGGAVFVMRGHYGSQIRASIAIENGTHLITGLVFQPYAPGHTTPTVSASAPLVDKAGTVADEMGTGHFARVRALFDPTMAAGLSESTLAADWQQYAGSLGAYRSHGPPIFKSLSPGSQTAFVPMYFASGQLEIEISFDPQSMIAGFHIRPPGFDQSV